MTRSRAIILFLAILAGAAAAVMAPVQALAWGHCTPYGVMCYRTWVEEERPAFPARFLAPKGDYMGSLFLTEGRCSFLGLGWDCRPCEYVPVDDWSQACDLFFTECQGRCFAQ